MKNPLILLLVDDEPNVLDGLRRLLRPLRKEWEVRTAGSGREALGLIAEEPPDVIISDMRMPEMDGAALLAIAKLQAPSAVRIVLSGQTDREAALRAVPVAHQFLSKPCAPAELFDTLARVRGALHVLGDERVALAIGGGAGSLPSPPTTWTRLIGMLDDERVSIADVGAVVQCDPAIASKLLQLTNSPFFGLRRRISNVVEAVSYLGLTLVKSLVLSLSASEELPVRASCFDLHKFQKRSMQTAQLAKCVMDRPKLADDCFTAGLLHDIGHLLVASAMPEQYDAIARAAAASGRSLEEEGAAAAQYPSHARIGAYLLNLWGLPWPLVEAVANHSNAPDVETRELATAGAVYVGRQLLKETTESGPATLDEGFVARVGLTSHIPAWRTRARELAQS
jgi:HD-like signal output (HDOD) protein/ActR/RegA family two-component response regulator